MWACTFGERRTSLMRYYVNKNAQLTGEHEVHREDCPWIPDVENRICLGVFYDSRDAVREARKYYNCVDGCAYCCPESHRR